MLTGTGSFPIGFRRGRSTWQHDVGVICRWARSNQFESLDLNVASQNQIEAVQSAGLKLGTVDLQQMGDITHRDAGKRRELLDSNRDYIRSCARLGAKTFVTVVGGDPARDRAENYRLAVESFAPLAEIAASVNATLAVEGYPGVAPHYSLLCTTPETCRAMLKEIRVGLCLNYDPSHLIRLGVDPVRFLREFMPDIVHVHAKDTLLYPEAVYELGLYQPSAFVAPHRFGQHVWRYTLPGHGVARWAEILQILASAKYSGLISIELEDEDYCGSQSSEKEGLILSRDFLAGT